MDDSFLIFPIVLGVVSFTIFCGCCCLCLCFAKKNRGRFPTVNRSRPINASTNTDETVHGFTHYPAMYTAGNDVGPPSYYEATAPSAPDSDKDDGGDCDTGGGYDGGTCDTGGGDDGGTCDSGGGGGCDSGGTD